MISCLFIAIFIGHCYREQLEVLLDVLSVETKRGVLRCAVSLLYVRARAE